MSIRNKAYRVTWEIDIVASSPRKAAEIAWKTQRNPDARAAEFCVQELRLHAPKAMIDLAQKE